MSLVDFDPAALIELEDAAAWYEQQRAGLAADFVVDVDWAVAEVSSRPMSFARLRDTAAGLDLRRARLARFPFALVFIQLDPERIRIVAVAHEKRRPGYWLRRVR